MSEGRRAINAPTWAAENPKDPLAIGYEAATRAWLACHDAYLLQLNHQELPKRKLPQAALGAMHGYRHEIAEQILERIKAEGNIPCDIPF